MRTMKKLKHINYIDGAMLLAPKRYRVMYPRTDPSGLDIEDVDVSMHSYKEILIGDRPKISVDWNRPCAENLPCSIAYGRVGQAGHIVLWRSQPG